MLVWTNLTHVLYLEQINIPLLICGLHVLTRFISEYCDMFSPLVHVYSFRCQGSSVRSLHLLADRHLQQDDIITLPDEHQFI